MRARPLLVRHAVDGPHGEVVEDDGLRAAGRVVESAPAEARLLEAERVSELVVVDWLLLQTISGRLEDGEHQLDVLAGVLKTTSINLLYSRPFPMRRTRKSALELANSMARAPCKVRCRVRR